LKPTNPNIGPA